MRDLALENPIPAGIVLGPRQDTYKIPDAIALEFEQTWETTSDLNDDDLEVIREEVSNWWGENAVKRL